MVKLKYAHCAWCSQMVKRNKDSHRLQDPDLHAVVNEVPGISHSICPLCMAGVQEDIDKMEVIR